ncbi:MAG: transcriptional regulator [Planctomycetes bacterium]|nr:transcriptional regulator [Planctomycetota bacterium]
MDDVVVRITRTIANPERLQILSYLIAEGEKSPTDISHDLHIAPNALSGHLAKLATAGLIKRRRSGGWSYCVAESPYAESTLSGMMLAWLRAVLRKPAETLHHCGLHEVRNGSAKEAQTALHKLIFEAATAFTDLRRLQILRYLARRGQVSAEQLKNDLSMSLWAVSRHTAKLIRRGYLTSAAAGEPILYRLAAKFKTPIHAKLFEIVRSTWVEKPLRTS